PAGSNRGRLRFEPPRPKGILTTRELPQGRKQSNQGGDSMHVEHATESELVRRGEHPSPDPVPDPVPPPIPSPPAPTPPAPPPSPDLPKPDRGPPPQPKPGPTARRLFSVGNAHKAR